MLEFMDSKKSLVFNGIAQKPEDVVNRADRTNEMFRITPHNPFVRTPTQPRISSWSAPHVGKFKLNVDAAVDANKNHFGIGIVGRDCYGHVLFAKGITMVGNFSPYIAELIAIREGLLEALSHGWVSVSLESDALNAVKSLSAFNPFSMEDSNVEDIRLL